MKKRISTVKGKRSRVNTARTPDPPQLGGTSPVTTQPGEMNEQNAGVEHAILTNKLSSLQPQNTTARREKIHNDT